MVTKKNSAGFLFSVIWMKVLSSGNVKISANVKLLFVKQRARLICNLCEGSVQFPSLWELVMIEKLARAGPTQSRKQNPRHKFEVQGSNCQLTLGVFTNT